MARRHAQGGIGLPGDAHRHIAEQPGEAALVGESGHEPAIGEGFDQLGGDAPPI